MRLLILTILLISFLCSIVSAAPYYADLALSIDEKGTTAIAGTTNYDPLKIISSEQFTSKNGVYWTFNLTTNSSFSDYIIAIDLPRGAEVNYMKASGTLRLINDNALKIIATGNNVPINIVLQYKLGATQNNDPFYIIGSIILGLLIVLSLVISYRKMKRAFKIPLEQHFEKQPDQAKIKLLRKTLTENQALILDLLLQSKEPLTQKQLQHRSKLPKATLSRNLDTLEKKNILKKQSRGMTNVVFIHDDFLK